MRRILTVAPIFLAALACASCSVLAQRGAARGGFSGHSGSSFHGGSTSFGPAFSGSSSRGFSSPPRYGLAAPPNYNFGTAWNRAGSLPQYPGASRINVAPRLYAPEYAGNRTGNSYARSEPIGDARSRTAYRPPYTGNHGRNNYPRGRGVWPVSPYNYGFAGYPGYLDYPWAWGDDSPDDQGSASQSPPDYGSQYADQQGQEYPEPPAWPAVNAAQNTPQQTASLQPAEPVTLVFNDGRAPVKIYNYLLTPATLYVMDETRREIAVDQLDLAATAKVNREAGIDFKLPSASR